MSEKKLEENKNFTSEAIDFFKDLIIIVIIVKMITIFLVSIFIINGQSMYASYYDKEFIMVDRFSANTFGGLKEQNIKRGDVVVVRPEVDPTKEFFIKRVIGLPGESVKIQNGEVFIKKVGKEKFEKLDEKYLNKENYGNTEVNHQRKENIFIVPKGKIFIMGDNRTHSSDSRSCFSYSCIRNGRDQFIAKDKIVGKVLIDFGYFNFGNFSFTHPKIKENGKFISTKPKWTNSPDSFNY